MDWATLALEKHKQWRGKLDISPKMSVGTKDDLSLAYTPGVAAACLAIEKDVSESYHLTGRSNLVAVVSDGTAVLGLGDIGPEASMPVMEGKCVLFKAFGGVDAIPLCIRSKDVDEIVDTLVLLSGSFGGINLEDISAPRCFEIEQKLKERADIPIFHDDQHGTAVVTLAAMINALRLTKRKLEDVSVVICGAGAAGIATVKLLMAMGLTDVVLLDSKGAIYEGRADLQGVKLEIAKLTNKTKKQGQLADVIIGADVFIGLSGPDVLSEDMVKSMAADPILFPMSNPIPEIMPDVAYRAGAKVVGTGRSDFPNQINNVLAFPGIFRGALDVRAKDINQEMNLAAAHALAALISDTDLRPDYIIPEAFDPRVCDAVAKAVSDAAIASKVAQQ